MDVREAQKELLNLLVVAVQTGVRVVYLFSDEDRLFVVYDNKTEGPKVVVLERSAAIFRALVNTMEDQRDTTLESGLDQEWCLDMTVAGGRAHFDMTQTNIVTVRIDAPQAERNEDDAEYDEHELAAALEGMDEAMAAHAAQSPAIMTPQELAQEMIEDILLARKPFPRDVIDSMPPALTNRLAIVPIMFVGTSLAVAVGDKGLTPDAQAVLARDLIAVKVDGSRFKELLTCYGADPRLRR